jgi:hypothetical protein
MARRFASALLAGSVLALLAALPAAAGGWASVVEDEVLPANDGAAAVRFRLLQHGVTPVDSGKLSVTAVHEGSGERVTGSASPQPGAPGSWIASFQLPSAGSWIIEFRHPDLEIMTSHPIRLASAAPPVAPTPAAGAAAAPWQAALLLAVALLALPATALALARRRRPDAPVARQPGVPTAS